MLNVKKTNEVYPMEEVSILLGAGFSAPMGYPIGKTLNKLLLNSINENFAFSSTRNLVVNTDGTIQNFGIITSFDITFEICYKLMHHFKDIKGEFDYEEFYDYINEDIDNDKKANEIAKPFLHSSETVSILKTDLKNVYTQVVAFYLKDRDGSSQYDNLPFHFGVRNAEYKGIINCIMGLISKNIIHVHTLNHDTFFESFNNTSLFNGRISDGFEELGSPYFGKIECNGRSYMVRLPRYTGKYNSGCRLYKLHGSLDYEIFYHKQEGCFVPDNYIKTCYGLGHINHYKEIFNEKGDLIYENSWINYHSDFLTGTTSKIKRYKESLLFEKLFKIFKENLKKSNKLIIIGYGAKDLEINSILLEGYDFKNQKSFIIDPFAGEKVQDLSNKLGAKLIGKELEHITMDDLE